MDLIEKIKASLESGRTDQRTFESAKWQGILYPELSWQIVGAAIEVHKHIGPGQLESVYQRSMLCELRRRAIAVRAQVPVPMFFKGDRVGDFYADLIHDHPRAQGRRAPAGGAHGTAPELSERRRAAAGHADELQRPAHGARCEARRSVTSFGDVVRVRARRVSRSAAARHS